MSTLVTVIGGPLDGHEEARTDCKLTPQEMLIEADAPLTTVHVYVSPYPCAPFVYEGTRAWRPNVDYVRSGHIYNAPHSRAAADTGVQP